MAAVRHLGFVIAPFWTTHDVSLMGYIFPANGVMIRSDVTEILRCYDFADLAGKSLFPPILVGFGGLDPAETRILRYCVSKLVHRCVLRLVQKKHYVKKVVGRTPKGYISPIWGEAPSNPLPPKFCV